LVLEKGHGTLRLVSSLNGTLEEESVPESEGFFSVCKVMTDCYY
jgi:hypothetical protein